MTATDRAKIQGVVPPANLAADLVLEQNRGVLVSIDGLIFAVSIADLALNINKVDAYLTIRDIRELGLTTADDVIDTLIWRAKKHE